MSKLEEILQQEAEAEIDAILAQADSRAAKIVSEAQSRASAKVAAHQKKIEAEAHAATRQGQSTAELIVSKARIQAKGEMMDLLRQKVLLALEETPSKPGYGEVLQALAEEAMGVTEGAEAVVVHPHDKEKLNDWAMHRGLALQTDPELRLGVRIVSRIGKNVENTLHERLHRAWGTLAPEVTKLLWE
ncbi:MAG: V-type ATP synthase subunit E [Desulfobaccales bacterium]